MGLMIISKKEGGEDVRHLKKLLRDSKESLAEACEMVERAEVEMQERSGYRDDYRERNRYRDDDYYERRRY